MTYYPTCRECGRASSNLDGSCGGQCSWARAAAHRPWPFVVAFALALAAYLTRPWFDDFWRGVRLGVRFYFTGHP